MASVKYTIYRTDEEIEDVLDEVMEHIDSGTKYRGMSYEDGLRAMFDWLTEKEPLDNPME